MAKATLVSDLAQGQQALDPAPLPYDMAAREPTVGLSIQECRAEIDDAFKDMQMFVQQEPDEIMRICAGQSARLSEIRVKIMRIDDFKREWRNVRIREVEPALEELLRQYTIASRLFSVRELDWRMESGER